MTTVGFVGLGAMGSEMVKRLLAAKRTVVGYNRTRAKAQPLLEAGMKWADTPRAAAEAGDVVCTMVSDTAALQAVIEGQHGILAGLGPGKIYVDMSTVSPAASQVLAGRVAERGAVLVKVLNRSNGTARLLSVATRGDGERVWMQPAASDQEPELDRYIERAIRIDPDIWVVEIEDREGRDFLVEPVERS